MNLEHQRAGKAEAFFFFSFSITGALIFAHIFTVCCCGAQETDILVLDRITRIQAGVDSFFFFLIF